MKKNILLVAVAMTLSCSFMAYAGTGWTEDGGNWHYYKDEATMVTDCFVKSEDSIYYLDAEGNMVTNQEIEHDGKKYSLNEQGQVLNSWVVSMDSNYYYTDAAGKILTNTTTPDGYYVDANGVWNPDTSDSTAAAQETDEADDEELGYQALKSLYKIIGNPSLLEVGYVKCMDISYVTADQDSKTHVNARLVLINYSASSSFSGSLDKYYAYEVKKGGSVEVRTNPLKFYTAATINGATNVVKLDHVVLLKRIADGN